MENAKFEQWDTIFFLKDGYLTKGEIVEVITEEEGHSYRVVAIPKIIEPSLPEGLEYIEADDGPRDPLPTCSKNGCEIVNGFLDDCSTPHYSLWYWEFKESQEIAIEELEKRLFELKDETSEILKDLDNRRADIKERFKQKLK